MASLKVVNRSEWLAARKALLAQEKEVADADSKLRKSIRSMPMTKVTKPYIFSGPDGQTSLSLADLFAGQEQLILYHFMFPPDADEGCRGCSFLAEHIPDTRHFALKKTSVACVSRAPQEKIDAFRTKVGWTAFPWYSCGGSDFNHDICATIEDGSDPSGRGLGDGDEVTLEGDLEAFGIPAGTRGDIPALSFFFRRDGEVYHTYTTHGQDLAKVMVTLNLLDMTALGTQQTQNGPSDFKLRNEL